jgi:hypothetical protein
VFLEGPVKLIADEKIYRFSNAWIADIARKRIWLASSISQVSSSAKPSTSFSFLFIYRAL